MNRVALITGVTGMDGALLSKFLHDKGYTVYGTFRRVSTQNFWRLQSLGILDDINLIPMELLDAASITEALYIANPDEVYHLAAQSHVGSSFEYPAGTGNITGLGVTRVLEAIRQVKPDVRFYNAATSELFGSGHSHSINEDTPFNPVSPYAAAKLYGYHVTKIYRDAYDIFATNGILFNHECCFRDLDFVTRKITNSVAMIAHGVADTLTLGNIHAKRDWGYAPDYVYSMWLMLQHKEADDFVIATNECHTVKEFAETAFARVGLNYEDYVSINKRLMRPIDVDYLRGDYTKSNNVLGWKPTVTFNKLIEIMVDSDMERWQRWIDGERFAWDAPNHCESNNVVTRVMKY